MIVEKFIEFIYNEDSNKTKIDYIQPLIDGIEKNYEFRFASQYVYCFGKDDTSLLIFEQDSHLNIQNLFSKKNLLKNIGGYNIYKVNKKLENPFFNNENQYLDSYFYFRDNDYLKKIKYFISKIMIISNELDQYPIINWCSERVLEIKIKAEDIKLSEKDFLLAEKITDVWNNII